MISGWRRITPLAEQGASNKIRSNDLPSHHLFTSATSAAMQWAVKFKRFKLSVTDVKRDDPDRRRRTPLSAAAQAYALFFRPEAQASYSEA